MNKKIIKKQANSILKKHRLSDVSLDNILYIISDYGFEVIDFNKNNLENETLLNQLSLTDMADVQPAFTYQNDDIKLVFVIDDLKPDEKVYVLAHELGHIVLGHLDKATKSTIDEQEANEFAHYLLNPTKRAKLRSFIYNHKCILIILFSIVFLISIAAPITVHNVKSKNDFGEYYVTETGNKYHKKDCIFVKNKSNARKLTLEEYESGEYEPCGVCLPDSKE